MHAYVKTSHWWLGALVDFHVYFYLLYYWIPAGWVQCTLPIPYNENSKAAIFDTSNKQYYETILKKLKKI